jgi:hypothetical protein
VSCHCRDCCQQRVHFVGEVDANDAAWSRWSLSRSIATPDICSCCGEYFLRTVGRG